MKHIRYVAFSVILVITGCGMLGPAGPSFEEVFRSHKGLMDSVRMSIKKIETEVNDSSTTITEMMRVEKLPVPLEYDGSGNNNIEIIPVSLLSNPDDQSSGTSMFYTGNLFVALEWTSNTTRAISGEGLKEEAGDYATNIFKSVREKYRYLCVYRYIQYDAPVFSSPSEFEVGYADMEVMLYDMKTAGRLGAFRFIAESDSLINYEYDQGASDATQMAAGTSAAVKELEEKCKWMIKKGLQEITGSELKVYVSERAGPYFVNRPDAREENLRAKER